MINAGTVGAYLTLDIADFRDNLTVAGHLLEQFRTEQDNGFNGAQGLGTLLFGSLTAPLIAAGDAAADFASRFGSASGNVRENALSTGSVLGSIAGILQTLSEQYGESGNALGELAAKQESCGEQIRSAVRLTADFVRHAIGNIPDETRASMFDAWTGMLSELEAAAPALYAAAQGDANGILSAFDSTLGNSSASGGMFGAGSRAIDSLAGGMSNRKPAALTAVNSIMRGMLTAAGSVSFTGIGSRIVSGIIKGMNDKKPSLITTAASIAASAAAAAKRALGINSPSRVMTELGHYTVQGMELGLKQGARSLYDTASAISDETAAALSGISSRGLSVSSVHSANYGDKLDRLLDAVEKLADSQTTMEIDGRPFGRLVRSASGAR